MAQEDIWIPAPKDSQLAGWRCYWREDGGLSCIYYFRTAIDKPWRRTKDRKFFWIPKPIVDALIGGEVKR